MQSANMFNEEQILNGAQRSPLGALDKAISTADTSCALMDTLGEPEQIQEVQVPSSAETSIQESQGSSTEKVASSTVGSRLKFSYRW
jgi:hypothetical protein